MFEPISDNMALSQKIVSQISDAIISGRLNSGDRLPTERALAKEFQVSRTAIRDAIKILSGRGLLDVRHGVGIFVAHHSENGGEIVWNFTDEKLRDVFEIRKALETEAAYLAAIRRDDAHLSRLRDVLWNAKQHQDSLTVLNERDAQFHVAIAEASQNYLLVRVMWTLLDVLTDSRQASLNIPHRAQASLGEHEAIFDAIARQDPETARLAMLAHLESVERSVITGRTSTEEGLTASDNLQSS
ncbi:FadR family transcriptional regulator [Alicyclobacillaceae bacterium I2511]|nr:FadR family transcriptional regulator [Alicyclobacillaceae bacterium I2511]